ncbi:MAG: DUF1684 domain-containing protein [Bacteroidota bacterium]
MKIETNKLRLPMMWLVALVALLWSCEPKKAEVDPIAHRAEIDTWHAKRINDLKSNNGWLNIAGLFWLQEGINTFGAAATNNVVFPAGTIADDAGYFTVKNGVVHMDIKKGVDVKIDSVSVSSVEIFHPDSSKAKVSSFGSLQWFIIKRDNQVGVRLRDLNSKAVTEFPGIERYPVDVIWRVVADYKPTDGKMIDITNVLGQTVPQKSPGTLLFEIGGEKFSIDALEGGNDELFLIFGDLTNEKDTYPAGRYLYVKTPGPDGKIVLDFNKAYNPPCAFTPFATCPLPPRQNILNVRIEAGEKNYDSHD